MILLVKLCTYDESYYIAIASSDRETSKLKLGVMLRNITWIVFFGWLVVFYGISTLVVYFMQNPVNIYNIYIYIYIGPTKRFFTHTHTPTHTYIYIILSCHQHGYPWPSLATPPYRSSLPAGPQGYIPYPHRAVVCRFELVALLLLGHVKDSIGVHHLWARPNFSSSVLHVWFV